MQPITIHSTKYDGSLHNHFQAQLLDEGEWGWLTYLGMNQRVESYRGIYTTRHHNLRWHWRDTWWDAMLIFDAQGRWLEWYCNVVTPPTMTNGVLTFVDLDLDIVWHRERGILIADADEFEAHAVQMAYPHDLIQRAWQTAQEVKQKILQREWRFAEAPQSLRFDKEIAPWRDVLI
jgi:protein associated with RNAse G/E